jgi:hypothetical protein
VDSGFDGGAGGGSGLDAGSDGGAAVDDGGIENDGGPVVDASLDGAVFTCGLGCEAKGGTCDFEIDTCEIPGKADANISCPAGSTCVFDCTGPNDCTGATVACDEATSCDVQCDVGHCDDTFCAPPTCACTGEGAADCVTGD